MEEYIKIVTILLSEYREVAEQIVARADRNRYVRASDRNRLAALNSKVDAIEHALRASLAPSDASAALDARNAAQGA